jgi:hypothetical protein
LNIFFTRSSYPQFIAALIDGPIDLSNSQIVSDGIDERRDGELCLARAKAAGYR